MPDDSAPADTGSDDGNPADAGDADPAGWWDEVYENEDQLPWEVEGPQPTFAELAEADAIEGRVLDAGCGTGIHALWAAERGHSVVGVDVSERGIERARARAEGRICESEAGRNSAEPEDGRDLDVTFRVANALDLPDDLGLFDTVLDSGLFHAFDPDQRETYADELADVVASGGRVFVLGFGEGAPEDWGPNPFVSRDVREAFAEGWTVGEIREVEFETREASVPGLLAAVERV